MACAHSDACAGPADGAGEGSGVDIVVTVASGVELIVAEGGDSDGVSPAGGVLVVVVSVVASGVVGAGSGSAAGAGAGVGSGSGAAGAGAGAG